FFALFAVVAFGSVPVRAQDQSHARVRLPWHAHKRALIVGYFPQWGLHSPQPYYVKTLVTSGGARRLDQINYAQGAVHGGLCSVADPNADLKVSFTAGQSVNGRADDPKSPFRGNFHQFAELKQRYPKLKVVISLEG